MMDSLLSGLMDQGLVGFLLQGWTPYDHAGVSSEKST